MLKLLYEYGRINSRVYWAHEFAKEMDAGGRVGADFGDFNIGGSVIWENFEHDQERLHYGLDMQYLFLNVIEFSTQLSIVDDGIDNNEDLRAFIFAGYKAGSIVSFLGTTTFYAGMDTYAKFEESVKIAGVNLKPLPNAFIKAEYQISSIADVEKALEIQAGFIF